MLDYWLYGRKNIKFLKNINQLYNMNIYKYLLDKLIPVYVPHSLIKITINTDLTIDKCFLILKNYSIYSDKTINKVFKYLVEHEIVEHGLFNYYNDRVYYYSLKFNKQIKENPYISRSLKSYYICKYNRQHLIHEIDFTDIMCNTYAYMAIIYSNNLALMKYININNIYWDQVLIYFSKKGNLNMVKYSISMGATRYERALMTCKNIEIYDYLISFLDTLSIGTCEYICEYSDINILQKIVNDKQIETIWNETIGKSLFRAVCKSGDINKVKLIIDNYIIQFEDAIDGFNAACSIGQLDIIQYLVKIYNFRIPFHITNYIYTYKLYEYYNTQTTDSLVYKYINKSKLCTDLMKRLVYYF